MRSSETHHEKVRDTAEILVTAHLHLAHEQQRGLFLRLNGPRRLKGLLPTALRIPRHHRWGQSPDVCDVRAPRGRLGGASALPRRDSRSRPSGSGCSVLGARLSALARRGAVVWCGQLLGSAAGFITGHRKLSRRRRACPVDPSASTRQGRGGGLHGEGTSGACHLWLDRSARQLTGRRRHIALPALAKRETPRKQRWPAASAANILSPMLRPGSRAESRALGEGTSGSPSARAPRSPSARAPAQASGGDDEPGGGRISGLSTCGAAAVSCRVGFLPPSASLPP